MKIFVSSPGERKINIIFPTRLLLNGLTVTIGGKLIAKHAPDASISRDDLRRIVKELNRVRKLHPRLKLVDVESADGDIVQITL